MRFLILLRATQTTAPPPQELMAAIMQLGEEATAAGALLDTAGLAPTAEGARIKASAGKLNVTEGPFDDARRPISYALYDVRTKEEAVEWASRFMKLHCDLWPGWAGESDVLRVFGPDDFTAPA